MIEGTVDVSWMNSQDVSVTPQYWVHFSRYSGFRSGAQPHKEVLGNEQLSDYLSSLFPASVSVAWRDRKVREWLLEVRTNGHLFLPNFQLTEEQCEPFRVPVGA